MITDEWEMIRTEEKWIVAFRQVQAFWAHDGNPKRPHLLKKSGQHSDGLVNTRISELLLCNAASDLLLRFAQEGGCIANIQGVVGPQIDTLNFAEVVANQVMVHNEGKDCFWSSPLKASKGEKGQVFTDEDSRFLKNQQILLCEDVLTTCDGVRATATAITHAGGIVLPFILTMVNRSQFLQIDGKSIVSLIRHQMFTWDADMCPLCQTGSRAIRINSSENMKLLTKRY